MILRLPKALPPRATIGVIAPASPQRDLSRLERGIGYLERLGYTVVCGRNLYKVHGNYLAGTDAERVSDIHDMFSNKQVDAIFCARGGYGTARLLPLIDYGLIRRNPKILVGFSDITALQLALLKRCGLVTFSGAMPSVEMADAMAPETEEWFWRTLTSTKPLGAVQQPWPFDVFRRGSARGMLFGGNLSIVVSMVGTAYLPMVRDAILVLEDVAEDTYRIDRMLQQLVLSGVWKKLGGVAFGSFSQSTPSARTTPARNVSEMLMEYAQQTPGPVLGGLMYGHEKLKLTLPFGVQCSISPRSGLRLLTPAVQS